MTVDQSSLIDLRTIIGVPHGSYPIKVSCPRHDDPLGSLAVYPDHLYCFGCVGGWYVRRFSGAALLMGLWDGEPETEQAAVAAVRPHLQDFRPYVPPATTGKRPEIDSSLPRTFLRFLLAEVQTLEFFRKWRGYSCDTIRRFELGWTGTHFSIPVRSVEGHLMGIRYRRDPRLADTGEGSKYEGIAGANEAQLFSLPCFRGVTHIRDLWITEGEYDKIAVMQLARGFPAVLAVTLTNGAGRLTKFLAAWGRLNIAVDRYVLATDQDEPGEAAAYELRQELPRSTVRARWPAGKDMSAYLVAGGDLASVRLVGA